MLQDAALVGFAFGAIESIITQYFQSRKSKKLINKIKNMSKGYNNNKYFILYRFKNRLLLDIPIGKEEYCNEFRQYESINEKIFLFERKYKSNIINNDVEMNEKIKEKYNETNLLKCLKRTILTASEASADSLIKVGTSIGIGKGIQMLAKTSVKSIIFIIFFFS